MNFTVKFAKLRIGREVISYFPTHKLSDSKVWSCNHCSTETIAANKKQKPANCDPNLSTQLLAPLNFIEKNKSETRKCQVLSNMSNNKGHCVLHTVNHLYLAVVFTWRYQLAVETKIAKILDRKMQFRIHLHCTLPYCPASQE